MGSVYNSVQPIVSRHVWGALILMSFWVVPSVFACKCAPKQPACAVLEHTSVVFVGTVTDTGPTIEKLGEELRQKLSEKEIEQVENSDELSLSDAKRIWARLLPKDAQPRLRRVRNEDELQKLATEYFPVLGQWQRAVRFAVDETFKGEHKPVRKVWTGQGYGDCGFGFELGHRYVVYAHRDDKTGHDETGICSRTREFTEASEDIEYLRGVMQGTRRAEVFGIVTSELDEFRVRSMFWSHEPAKHPVPDAQIRIESPSHTKTTTTDASGRFSLEDLSPGRYVLTATRDGFRFNGLPKTVELTAAGCSATAILAERAGGAP